MYIAKRSIFSRSTHSKVAGGLIWRSPVGFGPMPGPRQNFAGLEHATSQSSFKSVSLRMKTSRTLLQNLLPRQDVLSFASASTVAEVTWKFQSNADLAWLSGRGYSHFSLYIHGVQCRKPDGTTLVGDYLALMLEDSADPIVTGRDEIGFPKLFCDLRVNEGISNRHTTITASWDGFDFATLRLGDPLSKAGADESTRGLGKQATEERICQTPPPPHAGTLVHRYIPAVGKKDEADADYIVCVPPLEGEEKPNLDKEWTSNHATITFDRGNWDKLPTLHHIADKLEELPNLGLVRATIAEGTGVSDHKHIFKVV